VPGVEELRASTEARIQQYEKTYEKFITPYLNPVVATKSETIAAKVEDEPVAAQADDTAQAVIREETRRNPDKGSEILSINVAWGMWYADSQEAAISKLTEEIQSNPNAAMALNARGIMYRRLGRYDEARQDANSAVDLEPTNAQFHYGLGLTLHEMKQLAPALAEINRAIALEPADSYFYAGKASVLLDMDMVREAKQAVETGIRLDRGNAYCHAVRSRILLRLGSLEEADQAASMAIDIAPYLPSGQFAKSEVLYKKKRYKEALEHIDKALEVWPDFDDYLKHREKILNAINSQK
jgi:tetratricopeptide (TPR) repeat protein